MHAIINLLIKKLNLNKIELNFSKGEYNNLEALSLSLIFIVIVVLFEYCPIQSVQILQYENSFVFEDWINQIQNKLAKINDRIFGWYFRIYLLMA